MFRVVIQVRLDSADWSRQDTLYQAILTAITPYQSSSQPIYIEAATAWSDDAGNDSGVHMLDIPAGFQIEE